MIPPRFFSYGCPAHLAFGEDGLASVFCFYERMVYLLAGTGCIGRRLPGSANVRPL